MLALPAARGLVWVDNGRKHALNSEPLMKSESLEDLVNTENGTKPVWERVKESSMHQVLHDVWDRATDDLGAVKDRAFDAMRDRASDVVKEHATSGLDTSTFASRVERSSLDNGVSNAPPQHLESAKKAISNMRIRASDGLDAAKHLLFGSEDVISDGLPPRVFNSELCGNTRELGFAKAKLLYSNLGGLGPDLASLHSIRLANVFSEGNLHVDMIVTPLSKYVGTTDGNNAVFDDFLSISVNSGAATKLRFSFVDRITGALVDVPPFLFTIGGLVHDEDGGSEMSVTTRSHTDVYTWPEGSRVLVDDSKHFATSFTSMAPKDSSSKPRRRMRARNMGPSHVDSAVTLRMPRLSFIEMTLSVKPGMGPRNFLFSGASNIACEARVACDSFTCPRFFDLKDHADSILCKGAECTMEDDVMTCCTPITPEDCHPSRTLVFNEQALKQSNLGGFGPDHSDSPSIVFENILPSSAVNLDLVITAQGSYTPGDVSLNTVFNGSYGSVNVAPGTSVDLLFSFYDHDTQLLWQPSHRFYMSFLAFDEQNDMGIDQIRIDQGIVKATDVSNGDNLQISTDNLNRTVFTAVGGGAFAVTPEVSFLLRSVAQFVVTITAPVGGESQTLRFTGYSMAGCPPARSLCSSAVCPGGHRKRADASNRRCFTEECTLEEIGTCCEPREDDVCAAAHHVTFAPDSLLENNLGGSGPQETMPEHMVFSDILPESGRVVNMRISAVGEYSMHRLPRNGLKADFIKVDVEPGMTVHLKLEFLSDVMFEPVTLPKFYLTVADIDKGSGGYLVESVGISGHSWVNVSDVTSLAHNMEWLGDTQWSVYRATEFGDDRRSPFDLSRKRYHTKFDTKKSLGVGFDEVSQLEVFLRVSPGKSDRRVQPRSFYIGGQSLLSCPLQRASCMTFVCPEKSMLRLSAESLFCAGSTCTWRDAATCCHDSNEDQCAANVSMVLSPYSLVHSNLCGLGPDKGEPMLIYSDVFPGSGRKIDLEVSGADGCIVFDPSRNGLVNTIGTISLQAASSMSLDFKLVDTETPTRDLVSDMWPYLVTFLNMDSPSEGPDSYVEIAVTNLLTYQVTERTALHITNYTTNHTFRSGRHSGLREKPWHPRALMPRHLARSVALQFNTPRFNVLASVSNASAGGVDIMFAGGSNLACPTLAFCSTAECPAGYQLRTDANSTTCLGALCNEMDTTTCCMRTECLEERFLQIRPDSVRYSNLGGEGPDSDQRPAIVYADVFPNSGQEVDLEVTTLGRYFQSEDAVNGAEGPFGIIGMAPGTRLNLQFRFVWPGTRDAADVDSFLFTIVNVTLPSDDMSQLVNVSGYIRYELSEATKLRSESNGGKAFITSDSDDDVLHMRRNPNHPLSLGPMQLGHSVSYLMPATKEFTVSAVVSPGWQGQNIVFAGASNIVCDPRALCSTYACPENTVLRKEANRIICKERRCNHLDADQCCVPEFGAVAELPSPSKPQRSIWSTDEDVIGF